MKECQIIFSQHFEFCFQKAIEEIVISDQTTLNKILDLGFVRNDLQSLFVQNEIDYLTSYPIYFREYSPKSIEFKNRDKAIELVNKICFERGFEIKDHYNCFDFSFPKDMFNL